MATIEDGGLCLEDDDCTERQYCYTSGQCVDYTQCSRYNRREGGKRSRDPSQCGPCLPGHAAEKLGTGKMEILCKKTNLQAGPIEPIRFSNAVIISCIGGAFMILAALIMLLLLKKRYFPRQEMKCLPWVDNGQVAQPNAPPAESSPFIVFGDRSTHAPLNNNHKLRDKNLLVCATPCREPNWVRVNPNYENNLSDDDLDAMEEADSSAQQLQPAIENSDTWAPEGLAVQIRNASLADYAVEHRDNAMNAALVRRSYPSTSNIDDNGNGNSNADSGNGSGSGNSTGSGSGSGSGSGNGSGNGSPNINGNEDSESGNSQNQRERVRASNILITQRISMNINMVNND